MRVRTHLRALRPAGVSLSDVVAATGVPRAELSRIERGQQIPVDRDVARLEQIYGPAGAWYPPTVAVALAPDLEPCPGCNEPLDPSVSRRRRFHDDTCRAAARRNRTTERRST